MDISVHGTTQDLSDIQFRPGGGLRVAEFLQAVPFLKGQPLDVTSNGTVPAAVGQMKVRVQVPNLTAPVNPPVYTYTTAPQVVDNVLADARELTLARFGLSITALKIDQAAAVPGTAGDSSSWQIQAATAMLLRSLDEALGQGTGTGYFQGLQKLVDSSGRKTATTGNIEKDAQLAIAQIFPTGRGAGAGPDCLIGSANLMRALMATDSGQRGASGWRRDERTGLTIYHYMGLPFYRVDSENTLLTGTLTTTLFAANLGSTGLNLVHAYGSASSYGFQVDEMPINTATAMRQFVVHGAFALVNWEKEGLYGITNVNITGFESP